MKRRGGVLREPSSSPGLLIVEGRQIPFSLEGVWMSSTLPKPGLDVDVEFDQHGAICGIIAVSESQLAKEQAERALAAARARGSAMASSAVAKFGIPTLAATGALILGWFFLNTMSVNAGFLGQQNFSFWRVLAFLNSSNGLEGLSTLRDGGSAGLYGLLAWAALAGPFVGAVWKDKLATLGGMLPLLFMAVVGILVRTSLSASTSGMPAEIADAARAEITRGISIGTGAYLSSAAALFLGFNGFKNFFAGHAVRD